MNIKQAILFCEFMLGDDLPAIRALSTKAPETADFPDGAKPTDSPAEEVASASQTEQWKEAA